MSVIDAFVDGVSLAALQTALDLAEVGLSVVVLEEPGRDDPVRTDSDGSQVDSDGAEALIADEGECDPTGSIERLLRRVADPLPAHPRVETEAAAPVSRIEPPPLLRNGRGRWVPLPQPNVWGVPAVALGSESLALLGAGAAWRAYRDRLAPLMTIGKTRSFGALVRGRLGRAVVDRGVEPLLLERYGVPADEVDVAVAAPGLNEALTRAGSLTAAVLAYSDRHVRRETSIAPLGGWARLRDLLLDRLRNYGVVFIGSGDDLRVEEQDGGWRIRIADGAELTARLYVADSPRDPLRSRVLLPRHAPAAGSFRLHATRSIDPIDGIAAGVLLADLGGALRLLPESEVEKSRRVVFRGAAAPVVVPGAESPAEVSSAALPVPEDAERLLVEAFGLAFDSEPWRVVRRSAPFPNVRMREEALASIRSGDEASGSSALIRVGRAHFGDDLSTALESAQERATHHRRRLLGLAD